MTDLVACLSVGKGSWGHVGRLMMSQDWGKIILITNDFGEKNFKSEKQAELVTIDINLPLKQMIEKIQEGLKGKVEGTEVAINLASGTGKEHMALLSAIMKLGLGFRLMALTMDGAVEI